MKQGKGAPTKMILRTDAHRRAIASPLRLELMGLFTGPEPMSVADMAGLMGRPASSIHYHVRVLEKAGLLKHEGARRSGRRPEALYRPAAHLFLMEQKRGDPGDAALKTIATAFRMAERDMKAALADPKTRTDGPHRNTLGARIHCRLSRKELAELNRHLRAIETLLGRARKSRRPGPEDQFLSLTVALTPLRNRELP